MDRWNDIEDLFHRVAQCPLKDQDAILDEACAGDPELRREVKSLLAGERGSGSRFMHGTAFDQVARELATSEPVGRGRQIGSYTILALVGRGGMGEVYRARDTKLGREVAIKMLPPPFALDEDRVARFDREARLLAALNHPNIATIHGTEEFEGQRLLVLEFIAGETLRDRMRHGPVPVRKALTFALQIAEALESAHEKGVIHRDLKPANVKITPEGRIKVLDFGLAKTLSGDDPQRGPDETPGPEITHPHKSALVGTAAYMAPEQAGGGPVDPRADIWAFGCVLFEMLTGRPAFGGERVEDTLRQILEAQPDLEELPPETPPLITRLVRRCLEKNPRDRLQHIGDARVDIAEALAAPATIAARGKALTAPEGRSARWLRTPGLGMPGLWMPGLWMLGWALLLALATLAGWFLAPRVDIRAIGQVARLSIPAPETPFTEPFGIRDLDISSDGTLVVYAGATGLWVRPLDQNDAMYLETPPGSNPFFSPDGEWIAFFGGGGTGGALMRVPSAGGPPRPIAPMSGGRPFGGDWHGHSIVFAASQGLFLLPEDGGAPRLLIRPDPARRERLYAWPQFLPDGRSVLFTIIPEGPIEGAQIATLDLEAPGPPRIVLRGGSAARFVSNGYLVYATVSGLMAIRFDAGARETRGDPSPVSQVEVAGTDYSGAASFAISDNGTLAYLPPAEPLPQTVVVVDRNGNATPVITQPGAYVYPRLSPDQTRVALDVTRDGNRDVWIWDIELGEMRPLTRNPGEDLLPMWSPDASRLYFGSDRNGKIGIYSQPADGSTPDRLEFESPGFEVTGQFTPDRQGMLVFRTADGNPGDIYLRRFVDPDLAEPILKSEFRESLASLSPDQNWILYQSDEVGDQFEIFTRPYPETSASRKMVSLDGGIHPRWAPDGTEIYYRDLNGTMMAVPVIELSPDLILGAPQELFPDFPYPAVSGWSYDLWPGRGFLMTRPATEVLSTPPDVSLVLNWFRELGRLLPK